MEFKGLEKSLKNGGVLHGFLSGRGLRIFNVKENGNIKAYGEHPHAEVALSYLDEDYLTGGKAYHEVYGKLKNHHLTGSLEASSNLDEWLLQGRKIEIYVMQDEFVVELQQYEHTKTHKENAFMHKIIKVGKSKEFFEAIKNAFEAEPVEINND